MKPHRPGPIDPTRIRKVQGSFGWIPHEFVRRKIPQVLSPEELLLYFFLSAVADSKGVSFYGARLLESYLKLDPSSLYQARTGLMERGLILYREGVYQVLPLEPSKPLEAHEPADAKAAIRRLLETLDARSVSAK